MYVAIPCLLLSDSENTLTEILTFAESLIYQATDTYCSELQRRILIASLQEERQTYDQLAEACAYSAKYVKQDVAPKLWNLLSQVIGEKVTKSNARIVLESASKKAKASETTELSPAAPASGPADESGHITGITAAKASLAESKQTVLLVDDHPENLRLLSEMLDEQGYEVQQAINGTIALQSISAVPPDLVLLDINLPDIDGYSICQQVKNDPDVCDIPIIFISASDEPWDKVRAFSMGGSDYIPKPFKVVEVLARVENQLTIQQLQQQLKSQNIQLKQAVKELQRLAAIDELTQVANRRRFDAYLLECWRRAETSNAPLTLIVAQVNNFNFYGAGKDPKVGDRILYQVAQKIKQVSTGTEDLVARFGTLTFAIVLPNKTVAAGMQRAQMLQAQIQKATSSGSLSSLSVSVGVAGVQASFSEGIGDLLERCDRNLNQEKQQSLTQAKASA